MSGWKTKLGAVLIVLAPLAEVLGYPEYRDVVLALGVALGGIGIGHKIEKAGQP